MISRWTPIVVLLALLASTAAGSGSPSTIRIERTVKIEAARLAHAPRASKCVEARDRDQRRVSNEHPPAIGCGQFDAQPIVRVTVIASIPAPSNHDGSSAPLALARAPPRVLQRVV